MIDSCKSNTEESSTGTGQKESAPPPSTREEILKLLSFIGHHTLLRGTKKDPALIELEHLTIELAQNAHDWYYGGYDGPRGPIPERGRVGYVVTCLRNNDFLPLTNKQIELPAAAVQLEDGQPWYAGFEHLIEGLNLDQESDTS